MAGPDDVQALVVLMAQLFRDDAGRYGTLGCYSLRGTTT